MSTREIVMGLKPVGFKRRAFASLIDFLILSLITMSALFWAFGRAYFATRNHMDWGWLDIFINQVFPMLFILICWLCWSATPGKMVLDMRLVDLKTGGRPSFLQYLIRYFAYFVALLPFGLGILWVAVDKNKQGLHDKLAKTLVVERDPFLDLNRELSEVSK